MRFGRIISTTEEEQNREYYLVHQITLMRTISRLAYSRGRSVTTRPKTAVIIRMHSIAIEKAAPDVEEFKESSLSTDEIDTRLFAICLIKTSKKYETYRN